MTEDWVEAAGGLTSEVTGSLAASGAQVEAEVSGWVLQVVIQAARVEVWAEVWEEVWGEQAKALVGAPAAVMALVVVLDLAAKLVFLVPPEAWAEVTVAASNKKLVSSPSYFNQRKDYPKQNPISGE